MLNSMPMTEGRVLPQFTLREIDVPEVRMMEIGQTKYLIVKVEMVEKHSMKFLDAPQSDQQKIEARFQIVNIKALGNTQVDAKSLEKKDFQDTYVKARSEQE